MPACVGVYTCDVHVPLRVCVCVRTYLRVYMGVRTPQPPVLIEHVPFLPQS